LILFDIPLDFFFSLCARAKYLRPAGIETKMRDLSEQRYRKKLIFTYFISTQRKNWNQSPLAILLLNYAQIFSFVRSQTIGKNNNDNYYY